MDISPYLAKASHSEFQPTGLTKEFYLDMMEMCLSAYQPADIERDLQLNAQNVVEDIHAMGRIACVLGVLLSHGRKTELLPLWERLMTSCCITLAHISNDSRADFSVKEVLLGYMAMEKQIKPALKEQWLEILGSIKPIDRYLYVIRKPDDIAHLHNINIYNMVGEYLRELHHLTDTTEYFDEHWPWQLKLFDENGMYKDPGCPMLYDITTRCQIQIMLGHGYKGKFANQLDTFLKDAAPWTLLMQSAAFQLPYGGRSNQFLFNEALIASNCEYEATRHKKLGNHTLAGAFKRCAHLAALSIGRWLEANPPRHVKNFFPVDTGHGTEGYGYYNKYMVTLGSFVYIGYLFTDDTIPEYPCPAETGGYVIETPQHFHKIFANCAGQSIEIDTAADFHYDATGLGRYHKAGIPTELALSMPFTATPSYSLNNAVPKTNLAIGPGWETGDNSKQYLAGLSESLAHTLEVYEQSPDCVRFAVTYSGNCLKGCDGVRETYTLNKDGLTIESELIRPLFNKIYFTVPLFSFNGLDTGTITQTTDGIAVTMGGFAYHVEVAGNWEISEELIANRNGEYHVGTLSMDCSKLSIHLKLEKQ